jgi:3-oxoacyl-(acyl-carrier-protein) synthase
LFSKIDENGFRKYRFVRSGCCCHACPGTIKGDITEYKAIESFGTSLPLLTTNKWKIGHTLCLDFEYGTAILMMQHNTFIEFLCGSTKQTKPIRKVLINAVGFGGNAVSVLLSL